MVEDAEISGWVSGRRSETSDLSLQRGSSHPHILSWEEQIFNSLTTMTDWKNGSLSVFRSSRPLISSECAEQNTEKQVLRVIMEVSAGLNLL